MINLMRLEMAKNGGLKWVRNAAITTFSLTAFIVFFIYSLELHSSVVTEASINGTILVFASCMQAAFTVRAYKEKTIELMFTYPINRKKIMLSKMLAVLLFSIITSIVMRVVMYGAISFVGRYVVHAMELADFDLTSVWFYTTGLLNSVVYVCLSVAALFVGIFRKSTITTVVTSFVLTLLLCGGVSTDAVSISLGDIILVPTVLAGVSVVCAAFMIGGIEKKDIL